MGQKIHPKSIRMGISKTWDSLWYAEGDQYRNQLHEDILIREFIEKRFSSAGLERLDISRSTNKIEVNVYVARPGVAIGRGGEGIDAAKKHLSQKLQMNVDVKVNEVKKPDCSAEIIALSVAEGMQRGQSARKLMSVETEKALQAGAKGVRIWISGDFGVPKQSRTIKISEGHIPLQTLRAEIDFAKTDILIRNEGLRGVKVWVYHGDKMGEDEKES